MTAYRTNAAPQPATRPVLTRWQRLLVRLLSVRDLEQREWYRAHVGGRWCIDEGGAFGPEWFSPDGCPAGWHHFSSGEFNGVNIFHQADMHNQNNLRASHARQCSCVVYPWGAPQPDPQPAETFAEFREWYDRVRVVDLSRTGEAKR